MADLIPVVVLAGGRGIRIGGEKPKLELGGISLLDHALAKARHYSTVVAVSIGSHGEDIECDAPVLRDSMDIAGPVAGLDASLQFAARIGAAYLMIIPCDTPLLPTDLLQRLVAGIGSASAALPRHAGQLHPASSLWRVDVATKSLPRNNSTGRRSLWGFAETLGYAAVDLPATAPDPFLNINTREALAEAEHLLATRK